MIHLITTAALTRTKTWRYWRFETYAAAMRAARDLGLKDYDVTE